MSVSSRFPQYLINAIFGATRTVTSFMAQPPAAGNPPEVRAPFCEMQDDRDFTALYIKGVQNIPIIDVFDKFRPFGTIHRIEPKGPFCFVTFERRVDAERAMSELNHSHLRGNELSIELSKVTAADRRAEQERRAKFGNTPGTKLFLTDYDPLRIKEGDIRHILEAYGHVTRVEMGNNQCFVTFDSMESAKAAKTALHDSPIFADGTRLRAEFSGSDMSLAGLLPPPPMFHPPGLGGPRPPLRDIPAYGPMDARPLPFQTARGRPPWRGFSDPPWTIHALRHDHLDLRFAYRPPPPTAPSHSMRALGLVYQPPPHPMRLPPPPMSMPPMPPMPPMPIPMPPSMMMMPMGPAPGRYDPGMRYRWHPELPRLRWLGKMERPQTTSVAQGQIGQQHAAMRATGPAAEICPNVYAVGVLDMFGRDFHVHTITHGTSYNSYLIEDDHIALIDPVKGSFAEHLITNIKCVLAHDPAASNDIFSRIQVVVVQHAEPDHNSGLPDVMRLCPQAEIICSGKGADTMQRHYPPELYRQWRVRVVKHGESITLGHHTLVFLETPLAHWPDSMMTYVPEKKILFSMDIFGQHFSTSSYFDDEVPQEFFMQQLKEYFTNVFPTYTRQILRAVADIEKLSNPSLTSSAVNTPWTNPVNLDKVDIICPAHGLIIRQNRELAIRAYRRLCQNVLVPKVVIIFDSMYGATERMARAIMEGVLSSAGEKVECRLLHARRDTLTDIATEASDAAVVGLGSSTLNNLILPPMAAAVNYLRGFKFGKKGTFTFGTFGWIRTAVRELEDHAKGMGWEFVGEPLSCMYSPQEEDLAGCRNLGAAAAEYARRVSSKDV
ncbi:putative Nitric oxide reductase [Paratrimastix pyriformis]|uniref:Nitric oxide reductase n=1 Tax=Paratrimastix pyriformis TaxID=342808 RepID=A0ABQ8USU3_9EUKA|nr:putative Nitric oxide reductase [Paratrimastix pyriformis]